MSFTEYPKIDTLFERKEDFTIDITKIKRPVLETITLWDVTEKIDGTNIRICMEATEESNVSVLARTNNGQVPGDLSSNLLHYFTKERLRVVFPAGEVILFGEGYGAGIQKVGKLYRKDKAFVLFDVLVDGKWWLDWKDVEDIARQLGIESAPYMGRMQLEDIIELVGTPFNSVYGEAPAEGVIAKPIETLFDKSGKRVIIKLKTCDFVKSPSILHPSRLRLI